MVVNQMSDTENTNEETSGHCSTPDSDGEVATEIAVIAPEHADDTADNIQTTLASAYDRIDLIEYHTDAFADHWGVYDCFIGVLPSDTVTQQTAPLLDDKWDDPAVVVVDSNLTWAIPITGGHHGANQVADDLTALGAVPAMTTASEAAGKQGVETRAKALNSHVINGKSTVATNLAVLDETLDPVSRIDDPTAVIADQSVTVLNRNGNDGIVLGTGSVSGADTSQFLTGWERALSTVECTWDDVDFIATGTRKETEPGLLAAANDVNVGVISFCKETLFEFEGPTPSRSKELIGWPGIAEASAIAGGRNHELLVEKLKYDEAVTVAVGQ